MFDIAIIGAGPAGATLAKLLDKRYKILLIDRREWDDADGKTDKCCGGLLAPDAQQMLARLGLGVPKHVLAGPQLFTVRTIDLDNHLERFYQRHYINVSRSDFDRWLISLVGPNVACRFGCLYKSHAEIKDGVDLVYTENGAEQRAQARVLVGADGANSPVRRRSFPDRPFPKLYVSIQEWCEYESTADPYFSSIFDREITDFYSWTIPKNGHLILGAAIPAGIDVNARVMRLKEKLTAMGFLFGPCSKRTGAFLYRPTRLNQLLGGAGRTLLIGEAAGWISPSSAEGISYAMKSALALSECLNRDIEHCADSFERKIKPLKRNILLKNLKSPFMYHSGLRKLVMRSGLRSMAVVKR